MRKKPRRRLAAGSRPARAPIFAPNERWAMDFVSDLLLDGRALRFLTVVNEQTKVCPVIECDLLLGVQQVIRALERAGEECGLPKSIVVDNGPEFRSQALDQRAWSRRNELIFIRPGKPVENAFGERFNGRFREECLDVHGFESVPYARRITGDWRGDHNGVRPQTSLGGMTPDEFLALQGGGPWPPPWRANGA